VRNALILLNRRIPTFGWCHNGASSAWGGLPTSSSRGLGRVDYSLTAPDSMPRMNCRWNARHSATTGSEMRIAAAAKKLILPAGPAGNGHLRSPPTNYHEVSIRSATREVYPSSEPTVVAPVNPDPAGHRKNPAGGLDNNKTTGVDTTNGPCWGSSVGS
jgi:hypothetical protein